MPACSIYGDCASLQVHCSLGQRQLPQGGPLARRRPGPTRRARARAGIPGAARATAAACSLRRRR
eukprot:1886772-Pyramimonas_sp.AAC.1